MPFLSCCHGIKTFELPACGQKFRQNLFLDIHTEASKVGAKAPKVSTEALTVGAEALELGTEAHKFAAPS